jgi:TolB-like protein
MAMVGSFLLLPAALPGQCPDGTPPPCAGAQAQLPGLIVTPFENRSRDTGDAYLAATLGEDVTAELAASHALRLLNPRGSRRGAEYVLVGGVRRDESTVRVTVQLERAASGEIVWTTALDRPAAHGPGLANQIARQVLQHVGARRAASALAHPTERPVDPEVYQLYLQGRYFARRRNQADIARGMDLLQRAVARDSTFAAAWAEIALTLGYAVPWRIPVPGIPADSGQARELEASTRALVLDSANANTWIARASVLADVDPTSRTGSIRALRRSLALDSLNPLAWSQLGVALEDAGDSTAGLRALRRGVALDPVNTLALVSLAQSHFYWAFQYDSARVYADSIIAVDPAFISGHRLAGSIALGLGRWEEADAQFAVARTIGPGAERIWSLAGLAVAAAARGDSARARALVGEMASLTDSTAVSLHGAVFMAWGYGALGEKDRALTWLERYQPAGDLHFQRHLHDGPLALLRDDPRFRALLARAQLTAPR